MSKSRLLQSPLVQIKYVQQRGRGGRGVFATKAIKKDTIIEWLPCILVPDAQVSNHSHLGRYAFSWYKKVNKRNMCAIALGYGSLYNHSYDPNSFYSMENDDWMIIWALRNIKKNEEITFNYNGDPTCKEPVGFRVQNGRTNRNKVQKTNSKTRSR